VVAEGVLLLNCMKQRVHFIQKVDLVWYYDYVLGWRIPNFCAYEMISNTTHYIIPLSISYSQPIHLYFSPCLISSTYVLLHDEQTSILNRRSPTATQFLLIIINTTLSSPPFHLLPPFLSLPLPLPASPPQNPLK
jgi:hypothetical protein